MLFVMAIQAEQVFCRLTPIFFSAVLSHIIQTLLEFKTGLISYTDDVCDYLVTNSMRTSRTCEGKSITNTEGFLMITSISCLVVALQVWKLQDLGMGL